MSNRIKLRSFSPDEIKTQISRAVNRDMSPYIHEYNGDYDPLNMLLSRQVNELDSKYVSISNPSKALRSLAFEKFLKVNKHMADFSLEGLFLPSVSYVRPQSRFDGRTNILVRAKAIMHWILSPFDEDEWFRCCKHGTGTSIGVSYSDTSLEAKSTLPFTVTKRASTILKQYLSHDYQLREAVEFHNSLTPIGEWYEIVNGSRATTVPKSSLIDRMIAVEPTGNMFLQQGLMSMMYDRMKRVGLDLETLPTKHKERARLSSISSKEATIDWSSASDCVSIELLRWLLPPKWFECCDMVRSPVIELDGVGVNLNMFSTMGNAVTFPLETLVFYTLAHATRLQNMNTLSHFPEWKDRHLCSVFGDDCIVPTHMAEDFIQIMRSVGFIVNEEKSFYGDEGFRESCGGDYLRGYDVRPFYLKGPYSDRISSLEPWLYIIANRLTLKYILCFGERDYIYAGNAFYSLLFDLFRRYNLRPKFVPPDFPDDAGLKLIFDEPRFTAHFSPQWSRVLTAQHTLYSFLYTKFKYRSRVSLFDDLHYAVWLKKAAQNNEGELTRDEQLSACGKVRRYSNLSNFHEQISAKRAKQVNHRERRVRGGYVVARTTTAHWTVPVRSLRRRPSKTHIAIAA